MESVACVTAWTGGCASAPAVDVRNNTTGNVNGVGVWAGMLSSRPYSGPNAYNFNSNASSIYLQNNTNRSNGRSVRCVQALTREDHRTSAI